MVSKYSTFGKMKMSEVSFANEDRLKLKSGIVLDFVKLGTFLNTYLELQDRIIFHFYHDVEQRKPTFNLCRNIFCYSKQDGHLIWQIEQPYGRDHQPLEAVYKYINLKVKQKDDTYAYAHESIQHEDRIWGKVYLKPFRYGVDKLEAMTLAEYPSEYWVDYETGKVEWFAIHQKV